MNSVLMRLLPQPGQVFGVYPPGFDARRPSLLLLSEGVSRDGEAMVNFMVFQGMDVSSETCEAAFQLIGARPPMTLVHFDELFSQHVLKIEESASGMAG